MPYIGNQPTSVAFVTDTFSGNGSITAFTMSVAPANTASVLVAVSGVLQDPSTYSVSGTTLTFSAAPPTGTGNISARYLGIPASGVTTTAYRTVTEFTATAGQTTFTPPSYTVGFIQVYRNGVLLGSADYTATNGTTVVLASGATAGDLVTVLSFYVSSVLNAIPATAGSVGSTYLAAGSVGTTQLAAGSVGTTQLAASPTITTPTLTTPTISTGSILNSSGRPMAAQTGGILQVVQATFTSTYTLTGSFANSGYSASITPSSTSSKILVNVTIPDQRGATGVITYVTVYRNGATNLAGTGAFSSFDNNGNVGWSPAVIHYLDSPATTSSTSYQVWGYCSSSGNGFLNNTAGTVTIILMEVAG